MLRFAIDHFHVQADLLLLQGWIILPSELARLVLEGVAPDGTLWYVDVPVRLDRPDVRTVYTDLAVQDTGFFFYSKIPSGKLRNLLVTLPDSKPLTVYEFIENAGLGHHVEKNHISLLASQALGLIRDGKWRLLGEKAYRRLRAARATKVDFNPKSQAEIQNLQIDTLVLDHDMGGGANFYRKQLINEAVQQNKTVGLIVYSILRIGYVLSVQSHNKNKTIGLFDGNELNALLNTIAAKSIFFNNTVSHPDGLIWPRLLEQYKLLHPDCRLTVAIHDYFVICPSPHLLNDNNTFCNIPTDPEVCKNCLARTQQPLVNLYKHHKIESWRAAWQNLLSCADSILTFSKSSIDFIVRTFPELDTTKILMRPHTIAALSDEQSAQVKTWQANRVSSGVIGIVGLITSNAKGAEVVHALARYLFENQSSVKIHLIGCCTPAVRDVGRFFSETGPYKQDNLAKLVTDANPDIFLFTSIVPETFSFVLHEIAQFGQPIAAFALGAQKEFLEKYPQAVPLQPSDQNNPEAILASLQPFLNLSS
jgi:hypothetical protein